MEVAKSFYLVMRYSLGTQLPCFHDPAAERVVRFQIKRPAWRFVLLFRGRGREWDCFFSAKSAAYTNEQRPDKPLEPHGGHYFVLVVQNQVHFRQAFAVHRSPFTVRRSPFA